MRSMTSQRKPYNDKRVTSLKGDDNVKKLFMMIMCLVVLSSVASAAGKGIIRFTTTITTDFDGDIGIRLEGEGGLGVSAWLNTENGFQQDVEVPVGMYMRTYASASDRNGEEYRLSTPTVMEVYEDGIEEYHVQMLGMESLLEPVEEPENPENPVKPPEEQKEETPENPVEAPPGLWKRIATVDNGITMIIILILGGTLIYTRVKKTMYQDID